MALSTNLSAYYRFNNGAVTTDALGVYTLTNVNTVGSTASGKSGYGADFGSSNTNKYLYNDSLTSASGYPKTIVGWFYANVVNNDGNIFSLADSDSTDYYQLKLRASDSHIVFRSNNATDAADVDTGVVASTNTWYFYAVVINSTTSVTIQINATETNTATTIFPAGTLDRFTLGALGRGTPLQFFSGVQDEVEVQATALTAYQRNLLYSNGVAGMWYPFTEFLETSTGTETYTYGIGQSVSETSTCTEGYSYTHNDTAWYGQPKSSNSWTNQTKN